jgi:hypothetical protein
MTMNDFKTWRPKAPWLGRWPSEVQWKFSVKPLDCL